LSSLSPLQAPEPLYLAAQLVREMGLPDRRLLEFSYGRSRSVSTSSAATLRSADACPLLPAGCGHKTHKTRLLDDVGGVAVQALLQSGGVGVLEDMSERLRQLACVFDRPRLEPPTAMGRRLRRRSCNEAVTHCCGMPSLAV
jgi:hypothetical protein